MTTVERFSIALTANVRLKIPVYQKLVKLVWFQLIFLPVSHSYGASTKNREIS